MDNNNQQMILDLIAIISQTTMSTLTNKNIKCERQLDDLEKFLGVTDIELCSIVTFIVGFLPQRIYLDQYQGVRNYILLLISRELILFLVQEDKKSTQFHNNILNFKDDILNQVVNNIYVSNEKEQ